MRVRHCSKCLLSSQQCCICISRHAELRYVSRHAPASRLLELLEQQLGLAVARVPGELAQVLAQLPAGLLLRLRLLSHSHSGRRGEQAE